MTHTWGNLSHPTPPRQKWIHGRFCWWPRGVEVSFFSRFFLTDWTSICLSNSNKLVPNKTSITIATPPCFVKHLFLTLSSSLVIWMLFLLTCFFPPTSTQNQNSKTLQHFFVKLNLNRLRFLFCFHATFVLLWFRSICTFGTIVGGLQCRVGRTFSAGFGTGVPVGEDVGRKCESLGEQWKKKNLQNGPLELWGPFFNGRKFTCVSLVVELQIFCYFHLTSPGEMIPIWRSAYIFSMGWFKTTN